MQGNECKRTNNWATSQGPRCYNTGLQNTTTQEIELPGSKELSIIYFILLNPSDSLLSVHHL